MNPDTHDGTFLMSFSIRNKLLSAFALLLVLMTANSHELANSCLAKTNNASHYLRDINISGNNILKTSTQIAVAAEQHSVTVKEVNQNIVIISLDAETPLNKSRGISLAVGRSNDLTSNMGQMISQFQVL